MYDKPDVGFVNTHAEGIRADHDADISLLPGGLPFGTGTGIKSCVVVFGAVPGSLEESRGLFAFATVPHIHYSGAGDAGADARKLT